MNVFASKVGLKSPFYLLFTRCHGEKADVVHSPLSVFSVSLPHAQKSLIGMNVEPLTDTHSRPVKGDSKVSPGRGGSRQLLGPGFSAFSGEYLDSRF